MSHLTQILVPYELAVRQLRIRDTYDWHQRVWQAFGGVTARPREFLTRVDEIDDAYRVAHRLPRTAPQTGLVPHRLLPDQGDPGRLLRRTRATASACWPIPPRSSWSGQAKVIRPTGATATRTRKRVPLTRREDLVGLAASARPRPAVLRSTIRCACAPSRAAASTSTKPGARGVHYAVEFQGVLTRHRPAQLPRHLCRAASAPPRPSALACSCWLRSPEPHLTPFNN